MDRAWFNAVSNAQNHTLAPHEAQERLDGFWHGELQFLAHGFDSTQVSWNKWSATRGLSTWFWLRKTSYGNSLGIIPKCRCVDFYPKCHQ
jgi:hypothetical protein